MNVRALGLMIRFSTLFSNKHPCGRFPDSETLFAGLRAEDSAAIVCLQIKAEPSVRKWVKNFGLTADRSEDILNRATLIFLQKIECGQYQFQGNAPTTYLLEIAKNLLRMATRERKRAADSLENHHHLADPTVEIDREKQEATELVRHLLGQLGEPCATVIRLQHIEGYSDEEVVNQRLTRYSTVDSLKMKRSDCMKKLIELAKAWKISNNN